LTPMETAGGRTEKCCTCGCSAAPKSARHKSWSVRPWLSCPAATYRRTTTVRMANRQPCVTAKSRPRPEPKRRAFSAQLDSRAAT
jgi:hypothetical protein